MCVEFDVPVKIKWKNVKSDVTAQSLVEILLDSNKQQKKNVIDAFASTSCLSYL